MVIQSEKGFGFAKGVCVTSVELEELIIKKAQVVLVSRYIEDVAKAYEEATSVIEKSLVKVLITGHTSGIGKAILENWLVITKCKAF